MKVLRALIKRLIDPVDHEKVREHHNRALHEIQLEMTGIRNAPHPYRSVRISNDCHNKEDKGAKTDGRRSSKTN